ncbi:MAG: hypothetical protein LBK68_04145 [Candidatus Margulisbacteria bacterium]|jgi:hypothetical protein|nr:hypothetical protein [Candidatus Margulisiibacteriota bacterium]
MWQLKHIAQETPLQKELFADLFAETQPEKPEAQSIQRSADDLTEEDATDTKNGYYHNGRYVRRPYVDN